jgi:hypothetical protein
LEFLKTIFWKNNCPRNLEVSRHRGAKNIPKTVLKTNLKIKEITYTLVFVKKNLVVSLQSHSIRKSSVFLEAALRIISEI